MPRCQLRCQSRESVFYDLALGAKTKVSRWSRFRSRDECLSNHTLYRSKQRYGGQKVILDHRIPGKGQSVKMLVKRGRVSFYPYAARSKQRSEVQNAGQKVQYESFCPYFPGQNKGHKVKTMVKRCSGCLSNHTRLVKTKVRRSKRWSKGAVFIFLA